MDNRYGDVIYAEVVEDLKTRLRLMRKNLNEGDEKYPELEKIINENRNH